MESELDWLEQQCLKMTELEKKVERYEKALKAYGDEKGENILKALDETEKFVKKFNNGEIK